MRTQRRQFVSRILIIGLIGGLALSAPLLVSCGGQATDSEPVFRIGGGHAVDDGVVQWDPNEEPMLALGVVGDLSSADLAGVTWRHEGWQVNDRDWRGPDLRVAVETPGCGYGGFEFRVIATTPSGRSASVRVWMEPYICAGSPWLTE